jgi:hypothetical protein
MAVGGGDAWPVAGTIAAMSSSVCIQRVLQYMIVSPGQLPTACRRLDNPTAQPEKSSSGG